MNILPIPLQCPNCGAKLKSKSVKLCPKCKKPVILPVS